MSVVIYVVLLIWSANVIAAIFTINGYHSSDQVNGIFLSTVGVAFVARSKKRGGGDDE